jgi:hypothetical protein
MVSIGGKVAPASDTKLRVTQAKADGLVGLFFTGWTSAVISGSPKTRPIVRNVIGGLVAMLLTWSISRFFGVGTG